MARLWANNAYSTLASGIVSSDTTITVASGEGARFPAVGSGTTFAMTLQDAANNVEIVLCTTHLSGTDSFTITRAQEGTTARNWSSGDIVELRLTAGALAELATFASPALTGTPTAPNAAAGANTTQIATTAWVTTELTSATAGVVLRSGATGSAALPAGTTAERDAVPATGYIRYNSTTGQFEGYTSAGWGGIGGAQAGGAIVTNKDTASVDYVLPTGENGLSVGPLTINSGVTITVSSGQRWLVL